MEAIHRRGKQDKVRRSDRSSVAALADLSRTVAAVFFSGGISTITFNNAVQLPLSEMAGDVPCADVFFEATSPHDFAELVTSSTCVTGQSLSLKEWMSLYLQDTWPGHEHANFTTSDPKLLTTHIVGA